MLVPEEYNSDCEVSYSKPIPKFHLKGKVKYRTTVIISQYKYLGEKIEAYQLSNMLTKLNIYSSILEA